jgi:hypothetical protein
MSQLDDVLAEVSQLLKRANAPGRAESPLTSLLKHPIVITVIGSVLVAIGSNWVTKRFQLRDKQSDAVAALESEMPKQLALTNHMARVLSVLEAEGCSDDKDKKLVSPFVIGLTGKTCGEAEAEYLNYYNTYLKEPPKSSLARMRALFESSAVDEGSKKLSLLLTILSNTNQDSCIVPVFEQSNSIFEDLVDAAVKEIEGTPVSQDPQSYKVAKALESCDEIWLCQLPVVANDPEMKVRCEKEK